MLRLDRIDRVIIKNLQQQGGLSNRALAERANLSASACLARVARLKRAGIIGAYRIDIDLAKVGDSVSSIAKVTLQRHHPNEFVQFEELLRQMPEVVEAYKVNGSSDYILRIVCRSVGRYQQINDQLISGPAGVANVTSHVVLNRVKEFVGYDLETLFDE